MRYTSVIINEIVCTVVYGAILTTVVKYLRMKYRWTIMNVSGKGCGMKWS
jgi:hypothetical protein